MFQFVDKMLKRFGYEKTSAVCVPIVLNAKEQPIKEVDIKEVERKYLIRISNLEKEASELMSDVRKLEFDTEKTKTEKKILTNNAIRRLTFIKNEIEIREEVLNGFNSKCIK